MELTFEITTDYYTSIYILYMNDQSGATGYNEYGKKIIFIRIRLSVVTQDVNFRYQSHDYLVTWNVDKFHMMLHN